MENTAMYRLILAAALLLGGALGAQADNDTYTNLRKLPRGDDVLHADVDSCAQRLGYPKNGVPTPSRLQALHAQPWLAIRPHDGAAHLLRIRTIRD